MTAYSTATKGGLKVVHAVGNVGKPKDRLAFYRRAYIFFSDR
jgi:hypothetical protein